MFRRSSVSSSTWASVVRKTLSFLLPTTAAALLIACGGGGGAAPGGPTSVTLQGSNVTGATVTVATSTTLATTTTDSGTGQFRLTLDLAKLPDAGSSTTVTLVVQKNGYKTEVVELSSTVLNRGGTLALTTPALTLLPIDTLAPAEGAVLTRLGDGKNVGNDSINSGLQGQIRDPANRGHIAIRMGDLPALGSAFDPTTLPTLTLRAKIRGFEPNVCPDQIEVFQSTAADAAAALTSRTGLTVLATPTLLPSNVNGALTDLALTINTTGLASANGALWVNVIAGDCDTGSQEDIDDFEFLDLTVTFNPAP